ncbi:ATP-binding cassette domain-containing protein [Acetatifactor aquisgranensis]|uniref:ATP-binding cassette domain-containing protein n=1 Tax=Acetatifactor aquisgranensis TaxID=2941233 RepID=UPI00203EBBC5|nr:ATP-binding cassette domain-containing protein [Acetatifactor aquisgranensis]MCI8542811.1 ATP-binding cassette domain-containing protein [Lachnospiraceae bacterium]
MELLIDKVSKKFKDKKAVDNISLELTPGVWGLLGSNGAGKTTLMRMIAGIMRPTCGQVLYDGVPIQTLGEEYRDVFGFLPQEFGFYPEFTVKDYLAYVAALKGLSEQESRRRIRELLERVSLTDVYNKKIARLSGGMKRRVGIAQALLNDPEVLILDEPTGGLDPGERVRFRNLLSEFAHDRIVLISTHIVPDVEYIATCHAIIRDGRLLATGTTEELVKLVEGKVWNCTISSGAVPEYESRLQIVSLRNENDAKVSIRYLADYPCNDISVPSAPRLEDLYLWLFPQGGGENRKRTSRKKGGISR